ncbi:MAG: glycoside hydrolase family 2 TIM barrel-domain containing protein [Promethearchaeota archaeon]
MKQSINLNALQWWYWVDKDSKFKNIQGKSFETELEDFIDSRSWKICTIPSVWNNFERKLSRFFGVVFFKAFFRTPIIEDKYWLFLRFAGVNYKAKVWLNNKFIGEHEGGHTEFSFDIDDAINREKDDRDNLLVVMVDNSWGHDDWLPWVRQVDFFNYGGIHRPVYLEIRPSIYIADFVLKPWIEFPKPDTKQPSSVSLSVEAIVTNRSGNDSLENLLIVNILDNKKNIKSISKQEIRFDLTKASTTTQSLKLMLDPRTVDLWSPESPTLYEVVISLQIRNTLVDEVSHRVGFKKLEIRGTKFFLNNKRLFLRGTNKHEDHPDFGLALPDVLRYADLLKMKKANINCFRGSHYPPAKSVLEYCDELGLMFVEEIPQWGLQVEDMKDPRVLKAAKRIFNEMYSRDKNFTCLIAWSVSNETRTDTLIGRKYHEELFKHIRNLDDQRFVIHVSNRKVMDACYDLSDFICINIYEGWYSNDKKAMPRTIRLIYEVMMDEEKEFGEPKPIVLTEFGAGAISGYRSWEHLKWSEDYQADIFEFYIKWAINNSEFIGGTWIWLFHDFRVDLPAKPDKRPRSFNNKGMLSEYRVPKLGYELVRKLYNKWKQMEV